MNEKKDVPFYTSSSELEGLQKREINLDDSNTTAIKPSQCCTGGHRISNAENASYQCGCQRLHGRQVNVSLLRDVIFTSSYDADYSEQDDEQNSSTSSDYLTDVMVAGSNLNNPRSEQQQQLQGSSTATQLLRRQLIKHKRKGSRLHRHAFDTVADRFCEIPEVSSEDDVNSVAPKGRRGTI